MPDTLRIFDTEYTGVTGIIAKDKNGNDIEYSREVVKNVNFIDYDGSILYSYTTSEFSNLSTLPPNPTHLGLTSQGWNWTKAQITSQLTSYPDVTVWVGQMYVTTSGKTEVDITLDSSSYLSPYLELGVNGSVSVDWGDSSSATTITGSSLTTVLFSQHLYSSTGNYTIKITVNSGSFTFVSGQDKAGVLTDVSSTTASRLYSSAVKAVRLGSSITTLGQGAFQYCHGLEYITIPSTVTSLTSSCFINCSIAKAIIVPSGVSSIPNYTFYGCWGIEKVSIPSGVTSIGAYSFQNCFCLKSITFVAGATIGNRAFYDCRSLKSATVTSANTSVGEYAFYNCYLMESVELPTSGLTQLKQYAFYGSITLKHITIPSSVTTISDCALQNCRLLNEVTVPSSVTTIGNNVFNGCRSLHEIHFQKSSPPSLGTDAFTSIPSNAKIYVPSASLSSYQSATNWSTYSSYMVGE